MKARLQRERERLSRVEEELRKRKKEKEEKIEKEKKEMILNKARKKIALEITKKAKGCVALEEVEVASDSDDSEDVEDDVEILEHKEGKDGQMTLKVRWIGSHEGQRSWEPLYVIWYDFPSRVMEYRKVNKLRSKCWQIPSENGMERPVQVIRINGNRMNLKKCTFDLLWNNGFETKGVSYEDTMNDAGDDGPAIIEECMNR